MTITDPKHLEYLTAVRHVIDADPFAAEVGGLRKFYIAARMLLLMQAVRQAGVVSPLDRAGADPKARAGRRLALLIDTYLSIKDCTGCCERLYLEARRAAEGVLA